jgi:hypothetical protein
MNIGVPVMTPDCVTLASSTARARPKSVILTRSTPFSSRMFPDDSRRAQMTWWLLERTGPALEGLSWIDGACFRTLWEMMLRSQREIRTRPTDLLRTLTV